MKTLTNFPPFLLHLMKNRFYEGKRERERRKWCNTNTNKFLCSLSLSFFNKCLALRFKRCEGNEEIENSIKHQESLACTKKIENWGNFKKSDFKEKKAGVGGKFNTFFTF